MSASWPKLGIILFTYNREEYAKRTIRACLDNLQYSGDILFHIADDGSPDGYRERLFEFAGSWEKVKRMGMTNSNRGGYGASYNQSTMIVHSQVDIVLPLEDDWVLTKPLDIDSLVMTLLTEPRIGMIRLGYLNYYHPVKCELINKQEQHFMLLDPYSESEYIFSGHPRLETVEWARRVGPWPERTSAGDVELAVGRRLAARTGVAWPISLMKLEGEYFKHIGIEAIKDAELAGAR